MDVAGAGSQPLGLSPPAKPNFVFTDLLNWAVRSFSEAEARLTSVERLRHYGGLEAEPDIAKGPARDLDPSWPQRGAVAFEDVRARYAPELPKVLRGVSFEIPAGSSVGVIGRTGAGKSSLIQVLYRFVEAHRGRIKIDGIDIGSVGKERLRKSLAIIPQSPTLFTGTLRQNLDRFSVVEDDEIWRALQQAETVRTLPGELACDIQENGANFSEGQKQLLCLARALISKAKIIIMDEATANVDVATDQMIHQAIQSAFEERTVIIIAHRLGTISHCDLVIQMDMGVVKQIRMKQPLEKTSSRQWVVRKAHQLQDQKPRELMAD